MRRPDIAGEWETPEGYDAITISVSFLTSILNWLVHIEEELIRLDPDYVLDPEPEAPTGTITVHLKKRFVDVDGKRITLTPRQTDLAIFLAERPNRYTVTSEISELIWENTGGSDFIGTGDNSKIVLRLNAINKACQERNAPNFTQVGRSRGKAGVAIADHVKIVP